MGTDTEEDCTQCQIFFPIAAQHLAYLSLRKTIKQKARNSQLNGYPKRSP